MFRKQVFIALSLALCAGGAAFGQNDLQIVATVQLSRSEPITMKQLRAEAEKTVWMLMSQQGRAPTAAEVNDAVKSLTADQKRQILDQMINEKLFLQAAERDRITVSDSDINKQLEEFKTQMAAGLGHKPTDAEFAQEIRNQTGLDLNGFKDTLRKQGLMQKYLMARKKAELEVKEPTEKEIRDFYDLNRTKLVRPQTVRFSLIEIPFGQDKAKAKALADKLAAEINGNATRFDEAMVKGQSSASEYKSGDGGYLPKLPEVQRLVGKDFLDAAFALKQGQVSKMMEAAASYQIFKVTEAYEQKNLELDDIFQLGNRLTVREYIKRGLFEQKQQEALQKATDDLVKELRKGNSFKVLDANIKW